MSLLDTLKRQPLFHFTGTHGSSAGELVRQWAVDNDPDGDFTYFQLHMDKVGQNFDAVSELFAMLRANDFDIWREMAFSFNPTLSILCFAQPTTPVRKKVEIKSFRVDGEVFEVLKGVRPKSFDYHGRAVKDPETGEWRYEYRKESWETPFTVGPASMETKDEEGIRMHGERHVPWPDEARAAKKAMEEAPWELEEVEARNITAAFEK